MARGFYRNVHRGVTENFIEDASWVRLRNVTLGYSVPTQVLQRNAHTRVLQFLLPVTTSLLFTDYTGYDPESSSFSAGSNVDGFSGFTYPQLRSYLFSVNINF